MEKTYVTNDYFKAVVVELKKYVERNQEIPDELFDDFVNEIRVSNLLALGFEDGDRFTTDGTLLTRGDEVFLPVYTDDDEYLKDNGPNTEFELIPNDIIDYIDMLNQNDGDGIVINPASECFTIYTHLLNDLPLNSGISFQDNFSGYGPEQLKNIAENAPNDSIINFIRNDSNEDNFEGLMLELSKSILLNPRFSDEKFENYANNGIVFVDDMESYISTVVDDDQEYGILFTSKNAILDTVNEDSKEDHAYQITILSEYFDIMLRGDCDGVVINPYLEGYFIPRNILFKYSSILDNPSFKQASKYVFLL